MVLTGKAGIGKSYLLADIARKRKERKQFTILLLGQHFHFDEPWSQIKKVIHQGFTSHEYEASNLFFDNYGLKQPSIPLLQTEFSNPLFLKIFCEDLNKKGYNEIPDGYDYIENVDVVNTKKAIRIIRINFGIIKEEV